MTPLQSTFYSLFYIIFFSFCSKAQEDWKLDAPNWKTENLKGRVRIIEEKSFVGKEQNGTYVVVKPGWESTWEKDSKTYFDSVGNLVKVDFYQLGKVLRTEYFTYQNSKLIERFRLYHHSFYDYDSYGKIIRERYRFISDKKKPTLSLIEYVYDAAGNLIVKNESDSLKNVLGIDSIFYNQQNKPIKMLSYHQDRMDFQYVKYDVNGNVQELILGDDEDGLAEKFSFTYENDQLKMEDWTLYIDNEMDGKVISYFEDRNEVKVMETDKDGEVTNTSLSSYEFDQLGNWIKRTIKNSKDNSVYIIQRKITYF